MATPGAKWLEKKTVPVLRALAEQAHTTSEGKKSAIAGPLDEFLQKNASSMMGHPDFKDYYKNNPVPGFTNSSASPAAAVKLSPKVPVTISPRPQTSTSPKSTATPAPKVTASTTATESAGTVTKTPGHRSQSSGRSQSTGRANSAANSSGASKDEPRTPAVRPRLAVQNAENLLGSAEKAISEAIDRGTTEVSNHWNSLVSWTGIQTHTERARDRLSSAHAVTTVFTATEAILLLTVLLPLKYLGLAIPAISFLNTPAYPLKAPLIWNLLEVQFWATTFLWSCISIFGPAFVSYLINLPLKHRRHNTRSGSGISRYDPVIFNATKGLLTWFVFYRPFHMPTYTLAQSHLNLMLSFPGPLLLAVSSGSGLLVSLYEAIISRH